jgi:hypothetical protein
MKTWMHDMKKIVCIYFSFFFGTSYITHLFGDHDNGLNGSNGKSYNYR